MVSTMAWWLILLVGVVLGLIVVVLAALPLRGRMTGLFMARTALEERVAAAQRLQAKLEQLQVDVESAAEKVPRSRS